MTSMHDLTINDIICLSDEIFDGQPQTSYGLKLANPDWMQICEIGRHSCLQRAKAYQSYQEANWLCFTR